MNRIFIVVLITFLSAIAPTRAVAEIVGAIMPTKKIPYFETVHKALVKELGALGTGAEMLLQKPAPEEMAWKNATRKLTTLEAKVIVAYGTAMALAITDENPDVPVVYCGAYDPAGHGLVGRATGMNNTVPLKGLIGNLKKISNFTKLGILYCDKEADSIKQMEIAADLAGKLGAQAIKINVHGVETIDDFQGADALFLTSASQINNKKSLKSVIERSRASKIATASVLSGTCELGVIISLSANPEHQGKGAAAMVAEILKGKSPADLSANNTPKIEMTLNLNEAKALGLNIPFELLGTAKLIK